ncbi:MAG: hypothetical protein JXA46_13015 [Dehalococcoidales bacterium]|nr:hypothetical protein [Dehalococcoidales bacterium]
MPNLTGWKKDKYDRRDFMYGVKAVVLPSSVSLATLLPNVRNQESMNACVGFGIGANVCGMAKEKGIYSEWYSPQWIWNGARFLEGTLAENAGVYPRDALDWLFKSGLLPESLWPFSSTVLDKHAPSSTRMGQAIKYNNFAYYRVGDGVDGIRSALAEGHLVSIGNPWPTKWFEPQSGAEPDITEDNELSGGHETLVYAYNDENQRFYSLNSWGENWGDKGIFSWPYSALSVFKAWGGYDAHYMTFDLEPAPHEQEQEATPKATFSSCKLGNGLASAINIFLKAGGRRGRLYYLNPE